MRLFLHILYIAVVVTLFLTGCAAEETLTDEDCTVLPADECEANECGKAVTIREVTAKEPAGDDDCFGEAAAICSRNPEPLQNNALCIFAWRNNADGSRVIRLNSAEVPDGWLPCGGEPGEPAQCACAEMGGCGR